MKDHSGDMRQFIQISRSWYRETAMPRGFSEEISVGLYSPDGGCSGEFSFRWKSLGRGPESCRMHIWSDAWSALASMPDLIAAMAVLDGSNPRPEMVIGMLLSIGFQDNTPLVSPYEPKTDRIAPIVRIMREQLDGVSQSDRERIIRELSDDE